MVDVCVFLCVHRDVEGSIQEAVQEQVLALMLQPLQTAASAATNTAAGM